MIIPFVIGHERLIAGKVSNTDCFSIGNIGKLYPDEVEHLLESIKEVWPEMGVPEFLCSGDESYLNMLL